MRYAFLIPCILICLPSFKAEAVDIFVSTFQDSRIHKVDSNGNSMVFASQGLNRPMSLAFGSNGDLFVGNVGNNTISKIDHLGNVSLFASNGMDGPEGLVYNSNNSTLYVANTNNSSISKIDSHGNVSSFVSSNLFYPRGLAIGPDGYLYVANFGNSTISKIDSNGLSSIYATLPGGSNPWGLTFDIDGNLYSSNLGSLNISKITPSGTITTFGYGSYGIAYDSESRAVLVAISSNTLVKYSIDSGNGLVLSTNFWEPIGVAVYPIPVPEPSTRFFAFIVISLFAIYRISIKYNF
jgi:YVTN family beta-propeller protein